MYVDVCFGQLSQGTDPIHYLLCGPRVKKHTQVEYLTSPTERLWQLCILSNHTMLLDLH